MKFVFVSYNDAGEMTAFKETPQVLYELVNNSIDDDWLLNDIEFTDMIMYDEDIYEVDYDMDHKLHITDLRTEEDVTPKVSQLPQEELVWLPLDIERLRFIILKNKWIPTN